jgi:hypothetical protein
MRFVWMLLCVAAANAETLNRAQIKTWEARLQMPKDCVTGRREAGPQFATMQMYSFLGDEKLLRVPCESYNRNSSAVFFAVKGETARPLAFPVVWDRKLKNRDRVWGEVMWSSKTGTMTAFEKVGAMGDCGYYWVWSLETGEPILKEARSRECTGEPIDEIDPASWPKVRIPKPRP